MVLELLPYSSGLTRNIVQCLQDFEIPLLFNHTVVDIHGQDRITGVTIAEVDIETKKPKTGTERKVTCDTLLLSVGLIPENELSKQVGLALDPATNGPVVDEGMATSVEGIFAGGNVVHVHDLVDNVTRESEIAGRSAARYILEQKKAATLKLKTKAGQGVSYVVPQIIHAQQMADEIALSFRVKEVYKDKRLEVSLATDTKTKVIRVRKRMILAPGEIQEIKVKKEELLAAIGTGESAS
ncbi:MAG TPA: pyridine nucleotide-disulfide oxidoreductase, partial [Firmicutes bacterium]|nr:pyridine nucleotide-disulfide oxidoreductase [Bacillota bacterium]